MSNPLRERPAADETTIARTRLGLHELAEQVLAADLYRHTGHIGLRPTPGGIGTPNVIVDGVFRQVRTEGADLVVLMGEERVCVPLTTVADAADVLALEPAAPPVYAAATTVDPHRRLAVDAAAATVIADWYEFGNEALERFLAEHAADDFGPAQLWPEHFDLAVTAPDERRGELVVGVSPGDDVDGGPYAYVAWQGDPSGGGRPDDGWWNRPWGRWVPASEFETVEDLVALYEEGWARTR